MSRIVICGGKRLYGSVPVQGAKNSALPVMAACLLNAGITVIGNYPSIADVDGMQEILEYIGCVVNRDADEMIIDSKNAVFKPITGDLTRRLRASSVLIGPMLARFGRVQIAHPGGCNIGCRPLDIHLEAMKRMGAVWEMSDTGITLEAKKGYLIGGDIYLRFPSVGATENVIMAAVLANGDTVLQNAAREPEIIHLCEYLRLAGAHICGEGTERIEIKGGVPLTHCTYMVPADRIVAGTYMAAVSACQGEIVLEGCTHQDCRGFLDVYTGMGMQAYASEQGLCIRQKKRGVNLNYIQTGPHPAFPTDMQSLTMSAAAVAEGKVCISEQIFESRYKTAAWLQKMGADIQIKGTQAYISGVPQLTGTTVAGEDLRGAAALVVAGLNAAGTTIVENADFVRRGYMNLCENFSGLGADIKWENS